MTDRRPKTFAAWRRAAIFGFTAVLAFAAADSATAQNVLTAPPPSQYNLDERGVDLITGTFNLLTTEATVGPQDQGGMAFTRSYIASEGYRDNLTGTLEAEEACQEGGGCIFTYTVSVGAFSTVFGNNLIPTTRDGSTLSQSGTNWIYTAADGTVAVFDSTKLTQWPGLAQANGGLISTLTKPNGEQWTWHYRGAVITVSTPSGPTPITFWRVQSATNNLGYQLKAEYANNAPTDPSDVSAFTTRTKVWAINNAVDYCNPTADTCSGFTQPWQNVTIISSPTVLTTTDTIGRVTTWEFDGYGTLQQVQFPDPARAPIVLTASGGKISAYFDGAGTWTYVFQDVIPGGGQEPVFRNTTVTDPNGLVTSVRSNIRTNRLLRLTLPGTRTTALDWDQYNRLASVADPEGGITTYTRDIRNNITEVRRAAKPDSPLANIVQTATYPANCTSTTLRICNQPLTVMDPRGYTTSLTYDAAHGGPLTITRPAPTSGATQPVTTNSYAAFTGQRKNASGVLVNEPTQVWRPTTVQNCPTAATCPGAVAEAVTASGWGGSNVVLLTATNRAGDNSLVATTTHTYDPLGNLLTVDGPLPGTADTTRNVYDGARRLVGVIAPDPDGAGGRLFPATRTTYNPVDQVVAVERGTTTGQNNPAWAAFAPLQTATTAYNAQGRKVRDTMASGTSNAMVTQYSYDAAGRSICSTVRLNPAAFGSLPDACVLGTEGTAGPDRITRNGYDATNRLTSVISAYATPIAMTERQTWTANSKIATRTDGNNNLSTYVYDGYDRISRLRFPNASGGGSSTTDYEEYGYDAASNVTSFRNRAGESITYGFDALNRRITMGGVTIADRAYSYDNLSRQVGVSYTEVTPYSTWTWDALGRLTSETQSPPNKTMAYQYDLAGRRTRITWPDATSLYVQYDYDLDGAVRAIRENGATSGAGVLATYAYDNLGRRTAMARGNGAPSTYAYDTASRLTSLTHNPPGTAQDVTFGFGFNPASQITSRTSSNTAYQFVPTLASATYVNNGRNQVTTAGGTTITYDARWNITTTPTGGYGFNGTNELRQANLGGTTTSFSYDPTGRMFQAGARQFLYDGVQAAAEYSTSGALLNRYVPGPGVDEVVVVYNGSGLADRRWLLADERGSSIAQADVTGAVTAINTYDEYGRPAAGNVGRFQYTGQMWLPEAGVYHYKARAYEPNLGRFLQTDPVGYEAGLNLYAYVANDPVNMTDPTGACPWCLPAVVGGVVGGGAGAGFEYLRQRRSGGPINWAAVGNKGLIGAGAGIVSGATGAYVARGLTLVYGAVVANAAGGATGGAVGGAINACAQGCSSDQAAQGVLVGATVGGLTGGSVALATAPAAGIAAQAPRTAAAAWQPAPNQLAPAASAIGENMISNSTEEGANRAVDIWQGEANDGSGRYQCTGPAQVTPVSSPSCSPL